METTFSTNIREPMRVRFKTLNINGQVIRAAIRPGNEPILPLLVFNGIGANLELIKPFADELQGVEIIAFDAPGTGGSSTPTLPYRFSGLSRLIGKMLDELNYGQVNVLGVSWGGALAQQFAYDHPYRCRRLILAATSMGSVAVPAKLSVLLKLASPRRYVQPSYMQRIAASIYGGAFRRNDNLIKKHSLKIRSPSGLGYYYQLLAGAGWTSFHWLHNIQQPTLILAGDDDPIIPIANAKLMAKRIPNAELRVIRCGHLFLLTKTKEIAPIVRDFITDNKRRLTSPLPLETVSFDVSNEVIE
ncbi:poly(3-hydroxyalkanoate) depolymerase [Zooshikella ganghwensis]|uniref:poly(3-hydroxyalkanoate) depolymerase n=1 Tax=Zooshikella ganghwensis TaxID=202772 RepID=UPI0004179125|nr:poly(3-hydroxyalkanoate) depolymerase [Zooshikella ganghwensis]